MLLGSSPPKASLSDPKDAFERGLLREDLMVITVTNKAQREPRCSGPSGFCSIVPQRQPSAGLNYRAGPGVQR